METKLSESKRLQVLHHTRLLDSAPDEDFDRLTSLAARLLDVPIVLVSLVDENRQFFMSHVGLPAALAALRETPLEMSFCRKVVLTAQPLVVTDAREHPLLKDNPIINHGVVAYAGVPLVTSEGMVLGSFCAIDVKPRDWTSQQVADLRDFAAVTMTEIELRRTNEAKDRFIAMMSHELRTPLSPALLAAAELAANESLPTPLREDAELIRRNIEFEVGMIDALLDLTRITTGKLVLDVESVDVHTVVRDSVRMCNGAATAKSICVSVQLHAANHFCDADRNKLQQVFCNLINNAVKFSLPNGRVELSSTNRGDAIDIVITDSGVGISADALPAIFDSFQQGGKQVTKKFGGLGLGLAISKGIVEEHQGTITAASDGKNLGSRFVVTLRTSVPAVKEVSRPHGTADHSRCLDILLVEDHEDTARMMSRLLNKIGHQVVTANSLATAVEAGRAKTFDILMSDLGLPDGSGLELVRLLGGSCPRNGIALTGFGMEEDIAKTRDAGFQRHLTKPINFDDLRRVIREIAAT